MAADPFTIEFDFRNTRYKSALAGLDFFSKKLNKDWKNNVAPLKREMRQYLYDVGQALRKRHGGGYPGGTTQASLSVRTGKLWNSILPTIKVQGGTIDTVTGTIGSTMFYARVHEYGARIRARRAKYLTIPLPAALDGRGVPLRPNARAWDRTFVIRSKNNNLLIVQRRGKEIVPLYVLKKAVKIPARLNMRKTLKAGIPYFVDRAVNAMLKELVK